MSESTNKPNTSSKNGTKKTMEDKCKVARATSGTQKETADFNSQLLFETPKSLEQSQNNQVAEYNNASDVFGYVEKVMDDVIAEYSLDYSEERESLDHTNNLLNNLIEMDRKLQGMEIRTQEYLARMKSLNLLK